MKIEDKKMKKRDSRMPEERKSNDFFNTDLLLNEKISNISL